MTLGSDWRNVLRKAWSVRLIALAFACTAIEITLTALGTVAHDVRWLIALQVVGAAFGIGAFVARLVVQQGVQ